MTDHHATVTLTFLLPNGSTLPIKFVIDTGFTDYLCLPPEAVALPGLPFKYDLPANLADNSEVLLPIHEAIVLWGGEEREVRLVATGRRPLLGTALLDDQELVIQFTEGGLVTIECSPYPKILRTQANSLGQTHEILLSFCRSSISAFKHFCLLSLELALG